MTDTPRRPRKLAAILMLDVVGFSRMMGRDEQRTTEAIVAFHEMVRATVVNHNGRVVGTAGDSVFGYFDSMVEALESAEEIQRTLHAAGTDRVPEDRIRARMGLHLGDVIVEEDDVFGDGVNIAARLEQMADPGGIMLSEAVYHLVKGRTKLPIEAIGERSLKNISEPISVYRIGPDAFGGDPVARLLEETPGDASEPGEHLRETLERIAERVTERLEARAVTPDGTIIDAVEASDRHRIVAPLRAGNLFLLALGVLGLLARTTGWSENGWYPFLGAWILGIAIGGLVSRWTGSRGLGMLITAIGIGGGALYFDNVVMRAILWTITAAMVGGAASRFSSRE